MTDLIKVVQPFKGNGAIPELVQACILDLASFSYTAAYWAKVTSCVCESGTFMTDCRVREHHIKYRVHRRPLMTQIALYFIFNSVCWLHLSVILNSLKGETSLQGHCVQELQGPAHVSLPSVKWFLLCQLTEIVLWANVHECMVLHWYRQVFQWNFLFLFYWSQSVMSVADSTLTFSKNPSSTKSCKQFVLI